jgi:hypothetical protein
MQRIPEILETKYLSSIFPGNSSEEKLVVKPLEDQFKTSRRS